MSSNRSTAVASLMVVRSNVQGNRRVPSLPKDRRRTRVRFTAMLGRKLDMSAMIIRFARTFQLLPIVLAPQAPPLSIWTLVKKANRNCHRDGKSECAIDRIPPAQVIESARRLHRAHEEIAGDTDNGQPCTESSKEPSHSALARRGLTFKVTGACRACRRTGEGHASG